MSAAQERTATGRSERAVIPLEEESLHQAAPCSKQNAAWRLGQLGCQPAGFQVGKKENVQLFLNTIHSQIGLSISDNIYILLLLCYNEDHGLPTSIYWAQVHAQSHVIYFGGQDALDISGPWTREAYSLFCPSESTSQEEPPYKAHRRGIPALSEVLRRDFCHSLTSSHPLIPRGEEVLLTCGPESPQLSPSCHPSPSLSSPSLLSARQHLWHCGGGLLLSCYSIQD